MFDIKDDSPTPFYMQAFLQWKRLTGKHQGKEEWRRICDAYQDDEVLMVLRYAEKNLRHYPKISVSVFSELLARAEEDPVSSGVVVDEQSHEIAKYISSISRDIAPEYIQVLGCRYLQILDYVCRMRPDVRYEGLWGALPGAYEFAVEWYTVIVPHREGKITFSPKQWQFRKYLVSVLNTLPGKPTELAEEIQQGCIEAVYGK